MPWKTTDLPSNVASWLKALGPDAVAMWVTVANSALAHYRANSEQVPQGMTAEGIAIATATKAVKSKYKASETHVAGGRYLEPIAITMAEGKQRPVTSTIQVTRVGKWKHPRYGYLEITSTTLDNFVQNFAEGAAGIDIAADVEHPGAESPDREGAAGWVKRLIRARAEGDPQNPSFVEDAEGAILAAEVEWTPYGEDLVRQRRFRYASPEWDASWTNPETGKEVKNILWAVTLTNRPYVKGMAAHNLSDWLPRWGVEEEEASYVLSALGETSLNLWAGDDLQGSITINLAEWDSIYVGNLPDAAFAYIEPGGQKDAQGRTVPRSLRHLPHHIAGVTDPNDKATVDRTHLAAAIAACQGARTGTALPYTDKVMPHLKMHARQLDMGEYSTEEKKKMSVTAAELARRIAGIDDQETLTRLAEFVEGDLKLAAQETKDMTKEEIEALVTSCVTAAVEALKADLAPVKQMSESTAKTVLEDRGRRLLDWALDKGHLTPGDLEETAKYNFSDMALRDPDGFVALCEQMGRRAPESGQKGRTGDPAPVTETPTVDNLMSLELDESDRKFMSDNGHDPDSEEHRALYLLKDPKEYQRWCISHQAKQK